MNLIHKNENDIQKKEIHKITIFGLFLNAILIIIKFILGTLGNSQAVIADGFHSLSDSITDIAILIGVRFWNEPADELHPYGHKKIETVTTLSIGILLSVFGIEILASSISNLKNQSVNEINTFTLIAPIASILLKEFLFYATQYYGKKYKSQALIANAWHHRSDSISSVPVFIALLISIYFPGYYFIDALGAIIISLFIFKVSFDISKPAFLILIDSGASQKDQLAIRSILKTQSGVKSFHDLRTRNVADGYSLDVHLIVDGNLSVKEAHNITEELRDRLIQEGPNIIDAILYVEPDI